MTITEIKKIRDSGSYTPGDARVTVEYQVKFTGQYSSVELLTAGGTTVGGVTLPSQGVLLAGDISGLYALDISVDLIDERSAQDSIARYSATFRTPQFEQQEISPLDREPDVQWRGTDDREVLFKDFDGVWCRNSAKETYDPLPERPVEGCGECVVAFNTLTNPAFWCVNYSNTVNSGEIWGITAGKVLLGVIEAQRVIEKYQGDNFSYWRVSVPLKFNKNGWRLKIIDNGYKYLDTTKHKQITDDDGYATAKPYLLNGSGAKLPTGSDPVYYPTDGFKVIPESGWSGLLSILPNPFT